MGLTLFTKPDGLPVTVDNVKSQLRLTHHDDDEMLQKIIIPAAVNWAETFMDRAILTQTWELTLDEFPPWEIKLPKGILQSVIQIQYIDQNGNTQTLTGPTTSPAGTDYQELTTRDYGGRVKPQANGSWPGTKSHTYDAVTIRMTVGYDQVNVPPEIMQGILYRAADYYEIGNTLDIGPRTDAFGVAKKLLGPFTIR